ncbi:MAG: cupredoxin domain-containing protein [Alicyclobacillaceae bacterium]|nr:cupredoxin domain-containing protein [Alicyclobacillaceae bacterium]
MHMAWVSALALTASLWCPLGHGAGAGAACPAGAAVTSAGPGRPADLRTAPLAAPRRLVTTHIVITDHGFRPKRVMAVINQPIHIVVVNKGSRVHQFSIPRYYIFTENLKPGQSSDIRFSPWQPGRFDMTSDPSGQNRPEFRGEFIVTDAK